VVELDVVSIVEHGCEMGLFAWIVSENQRIRESENQRIRESES